MKRLVAFTVDHFANNPAFVRLTNTEDLQRGAFIRKSKLIPELSTPLIENIRLLLASGAQDGSFRQSVDPLQL